ncbi:hypothetical protein JTB14_027159 [Gonioctena quinquepunctata]|nr:hypothetical protein JTB14_027159 [Gonioctena quinquepunctata]
MEKEHGNEDARPTRHNACINRSLTTGYVWPVGFGTGNPGFASFLSEQVSTSEPLQSAEELVFPENHSSIVESAKESDTTVVENGIKSIKSLRQHSVGKSCSSLSRSSERMSQA